MADEKKEEVVITETQERPFGAERLNPSPSERYNTLNDIKPVSYFDENNPEGELREGRVDVAEDSASVDKSKLRAAQQKEQDRQFIKRGMARRNDPLAVSTQTLENNYRQGIRDARKNEVVVGTGMRLADDRSWERGNKSLNHTLQTIEASKVAEQGAMKRKEEQMLRNNEAMLAIYDGVASTKALLDGMDVSNPYYANNPQHIFDYTERPVIGQDEKGAAIYGEPTAVPGMKVKRAFLQPEIIEGINKRLKEKGNKNFEILDVRAEQNFSQKTGSTAGDPTFIVTGQTFDPKTNKWVSSEKKLSMKELYNIGVKRGVGAGLDKDVAEQNVISVLGDIYGRVKPSEKMRIEQMKENGRNARAIFKSQSVQKGNNESLKDLISAATQMEQHIQRNGASMSEEQLKQMQQTIQNIYSRISSVVMPQSAPSNGGSGQPGTQQPKRGDVGYRWADQNGQWWEVTQVGNSKGKRKIEAPE